MEWIIQLPVLFFSVVVHEFCHGWEAGRRGDDTAERAGRLTLNPLAHIDAFGTVFLPFLCFVFQTPMFGWAKPVPVDPRRLKDPARDMVRVALVGPLANLGLAFAAAAGAKLAALAGGPPGGYFETAAGALRFAVVVNLFLAFFNLIPLSPLDGSQVAAGLLPPGLRRAYDRHIPYGTFLILMLLLTKGLSALVSWPVRAALDLLGWIGLLG